MTTVGLNLELPSLLSDLCVVWVLLVVHLATAAVPELQTPFGLMRIRRYKVLCRQCSVAVPITSALTPAPKSQVYL